MTSIENALSRAWEAHSGKPQFDAFEHLFTAVQLIHCWIKTQEARSLPHDPLRKRLEEVAQWLRETHCQMGDEGARQELASIEAVLSQKQPLEPPEAPEGSIVPPDWESRCNRQRAAIREAIAWLSFNRPAEAVEELKGALK